MKVLITDDEERQKRFYESLGYKNTKYLSRILVSDRRDFYRKSRGTWYGGI